MRMVGVIVLALIVGFFLGMVLSQIIGITSMLLFDRAVGIKFLPLYSALACGITLPSVLRRKARSPIHQRMKPTNEHDSLEYP